MESQTQHFITRGLLKPWEYKPGMVKYFDFVDQKVHSKRSKRMFSDTNIWNDQLDNQRLSQAIIESRKQCESTIKLAKSYGLEPQYLKNLFEKNFCHYSEKG